MFSMIRAHQRVIMTVIKNTDLDPNYDLIDWIHRSVCPLVDDKNNARI